jgi:hypothetical protein
MSPADDFNSKINPCNERQCDFKNKILYNSYNKQHLSLDSFNLLSFALSFDVFLIVIGQVYT